MKILATALAIALISVSAKAKDLDGNTLLEMCASPNLRVNVAFYAAGVAQGAALAEKKVFCIPAGVNMQRMADTACKFVTENLDVRHHSAGTVVARSFGLAWPCSDR